MISRAMNAKAYKVNKDTAKGDSTPSDDNPGPCKRFSDYFQNKGCIGVVRFLFQKVSECFRTGCCSIYYDPYERFRDYFVMKSFLDDFVIVPLQTLFELLRKCCCCFLYGREGLSEGEKQETASTKEDPLPRGASTKNPFPRGNPRVVLFIDDIDRCPPEKAFDVIVEVLKS